MASWMVHFRIADKLMEYLDQINSFPNVYLDYFSEVAIEKRIKYISEFYNLHESVLEREYPYLNEEQMNTFVLEAIDDIRQDLILRNIIKP